MIQITITDSIADDLKKKQQELNKLYKESHTEFVKLTPIDSGNARRRTTLRGDTISANYPYAKRLDEGWSKQAPDGITKPWQAWLERRLKTIFER